MWIIKTISAMKKTWKTKRIIKMFKIKRINYKDIQWEIKSDKFNSLKTNSFIKRNHMQLARIIRI